ncbi:hypothetical protein M1555_05555 [Patescibacteria group bacterium]|nr:hypothetical protein [Patescibacteria group bacterium]
MTNLDDLSAIQTLDAENVRGSIELVGKQCRQAWDDVRGIAFPAAYRTPSSIVFAGMGGSALGAYMIRSLFFDTIPVPFEIVNDYHLPPYVNEKTLVIVCSYSGTTEEAISCAREAIGKHAMLTGITEGKTLGELFRSSDTPAYLFTPTYNPSNQPRLGTGYTAYSQFAILTALGLVSVTDRDTDDVVRVAEEGNKAYGLSVPTSGNPAKALAHTWFEKIPIIVSAEFLKQVGRIIRNQFHECAKSFAAYHDIPELNHHLMEALTYPEGNKSLLSFLFLDSPLYSPRIKKRVGITKDVVKRQGMHVEEFVPTSSTKITQAFECVQFGAYVNYYMSMLYGINPSKIPWVDYFKTELAKE